MKLKPTYSVSLLPTRIRILKPGDSASKRRGKAAACLKDGDFPGGASYRDFMYGFFSSVLGNALMIEDSRSGFRVAELVPSKPTGSGFIHGRIESGKYGFESQLVDVNDANNAGKAKKREMTDCELIPFFFAMDFHPGKDSSILLTEQFGPYSPKSILLEQLRKYVAEKMPGHKVSSETIVSPDIVEEVLSKHVKALRFQFDRVPPDIADGIDRDDNDHLERDGTMEVVIKSKNGRLREWGFEHLNDVRKTGITVNDATSTDLKVDMEIDGKQKTVNLGNTDSFNTSFSVDAKGEIEENGHPSINRMLSEAMDDFAICRKALGWPKDRNGDSIERRVGP